MKWEDEVKQDLKVKQFHQWKEQAKSRDECKPITKQAKTRKQLLRRQKKDKNKKYGQLG
jgi:hypothetical protein